MNAVSNPGQVLITIELAQEDRDRIDALIASSGDAGGKPAAKKGTAKKADEKPAVTAADDNATEPGVDRDAVRATLKQYAALEGKDAAIKILKDHDAPSIGELAEEHFAAVIAACGD